VTKYRVTVGLCADADISRQWFITMPANTNGEIRRAIKRLSSEKYVKEMVEKVNR